ncbi:MAG: VWA domain-containing protein [Minicystis sp.]
MQLRALPGVAFALAAAACSAGSQVTSSSGTGGATTSGSVANSSSSGVGGGSLFDSGPLTDAEAGLDPDAACGLVTVDAKATPADIYITVDKSSSLAGNKWTAAVNGLGAFVNDSASTGIVVALNFFPLDNNPTCDQFAYKPPVVPYGPLPANATPITSALAAAMPNGFNSPMYPALGGAILASIEDAQNNPGHTASVLLVTDGQPDGPSTSCGSANPNDPAAVAQLAATGLSKGVKTFVIGLPGVNQAVANQIAAAGGTSKAILVASTNVQTEFQNALAQVRGEALPCEYDLPDQVTMGDVDFQHVNVELTPTGQSTAILPQDPSCKDMGWKYDDPSHPTKIIFCPNTCQSVKADLGGKVQILLGCKTVTPA